MVEEPVVFLEAKVKVRLDPLPARVISARAMTALFEVSATKFKEAVPASSAMVKARGPVLWFKFKL